jgi:hypothetical protein
VSVDYVAPAGHSSVDWISIHEVGTSDHETVGFEFVGAATSGTVSLTVPSFATQGASYEILYYLDNTYQIADTLSPPFTAVAPLPYSVSAGSSTASPGTDVTASWSAPANHATNDWIGLFQSGATNQQITTYSFVGAAGQTSGSLALTVPPSANPGDTFELRYFANNTYNRVSTSGTITVGMVLTAPAGSVAPGSDVTTTWNAPANHATNDWIGLFKVGGASQAPEDFDFVGSAGLTTGQITLTMPANAQTGQAYEFRYFPNNGYVVSGNSPSFTAGGTATYTVAETQGPVTAGSPVDASWTAPTGHSGSDWIGIYAVGSSTIVNYAYVGQAGQTSGTTSITVPSGTAPGSYEFHYNLNNTYKVGAASSPFQVN